MAGIDLLETTRPPEQTAIDLVAIVAGILRDVADLRRRHEAATGGQLPGGEEIGPAADAVAVLPAIAVAARIGSARLFAAWPPVARAAPLTPAGHRLAHRGIEKPGLGPAVATGPCRGRPSRSDEREDQHREHRRGACRAPPGGEGGVHASRYRPAEPSCSAHSGRASASPQIAPSHSGQMAAERAPETTPIPASGPLHRRRRGGQGALVEAEIFPGTGVP